MLLHIRISVSTHEHERLLQPASKQTASQSDRVPTKGEEKENVAGGGGAIRCTAEDTVTHMTPELDLGDLWR